jgi:hypothetical protein
MNPKLVQGDQLGATRPYGSDPVQPSSPDDLADILLGKRGSGGSVRAGWPYWVGENGPEPFVPSQDGFVLSKQDAANAVARASMPQAIGASVGSSSSGSQSFSDAAIVGELRSLRSELHRLKFDFKLNQSTFASAASRGMQNRARARR